MLWKSCVLSSCDCALEQLFCCTVMNLRVIKISVKLYSRYSICTWANLCGKYIIFNSIAFKSWLWLGNITASSANYIMGDSLLMKPLFVTLQSCAKFLSWAVRALLLCCQGFQSSRRGQIVWKILNTCGFGFVLRDPTWICWKADGCCCCHRPRTPSSCILLLWLVFTYA